MKSKNFYDLGAEAFKCGEVKEGDASAFQADEFFLRKAFKHTSDDFSCGAGEGSYLFMGIAYIGVFCAVIFGGKELSEAFIIAFEEDLLHREHDI